MYGPLFIPLPIKKILFSLLFITDKIAMNICTQNFYDSIYFSMTNIHEYYFWVYCDLYVPL